jgi:hypothetical protein
MNSAEKEKLNELLKEVDNLNDSETILNVLKDIDHYLESMGHLERNLKVDDQTLVVSNSLKRKAE